MRALALVALACTSLLPRAAAAADCVPPRARLSTVIGLAYCIDPAFEAVVGEQVLKIRADIAVHRRAGKLVAYTSGPVSSLAGGNERINLEIAASVRARLEKELGDLVWVLDPTPYRISSQGAREPGREEHMLMWIRVVAGDDGLGRDFDMAHFAGPGDARVYFGCGAVDLTGCLSRWIAARVASDGDFRREVAAVPGQQSAFLRYYALLASSAYSKEAHDEWNAFARINRRRQLGDQIGMFFDGRPLSPAELETQVSSGYESR